MKRRWTLAERLAPYSTRGRFDFALATRSRALARVGRAPLFALSTKLWRS